MHDPRCVRRVKAREELARDVYRLARGEGAPPRDLLAQRAAIEALHNKERAPVLGLPEIAHLDEVWVAQEGERLRLDAHSIGEIGPLSVPRMKELYDHPLSERDVLRLKDLAHPASPERREDAVARARYDNARLERRYATLMSRVVRRGHGPSSSIVMGPYTISTARQNCRRRSTAAPVDLLYR
jgi:hypothetical protein